MLDLHFHCLPAVDDGAGSLAEGLEMCRLAWEDGCRAVVATPHQGHSRWPNTDPAALEPLVATLNERLDGRPVVYLGGEIRIGSELFAVLDDPRIGGFLPLAGSRYLLIEFPRGAPIDRPEELVHELCVRGWRPVIAHPEFYPQLARDHLLAARLVDAGASFQVTAMSLTGGFGRRVRNAATGLLDAGLVDFVASDAHGVEHRPPGLTAVRQLLATRHDAETARRLTDDNPRAVVRDEPLADSALAKRALSLA